MSRMIRRVTFVCLGMLAACAPSLEPIRVPEAPRMITIPAGWFLMGSDSGPASSRPSHRVYLDAYEIDATEVTVSAIAAYLDRSGVTLTVGAGPGQTDQPAWPAAGLLWAEARDYCVWRGARLPTEAEWEKAARGTDGRAYPWGESWDAGRANTSEAGPGHPLPVGGYAEGMSPYGVYDMAGNVAEWVADYFDPAYYASAPALNPTGPVKILDHGLRGGSWASDHRLALSYFRDSSHSARPNPRVGFRCARSISASGQ